MVKLILAVAAAVLLNWNYIFGEKPTAASSTAAASNKGEASTAADGDNTEAKKGKKGKKTGELPPDTPGDYARMLLMVQGNDWGADPFGAPAKTNIVADSQSNAMPAVENEEGEEKEELKVESIMITPLQSLAVVNGQILAEGDMFQGKRITRITRDTVVMKSKGGVRELKLKDSGIPMVYEKSLVEGKR